MIFFKTKLFIFQTNERLAGFHGVRFNNCLLDAFVDMPWRLYMFIAQTSKLTTTLIFIFHVYVHHYLKKKKKILCAHTIHIIISRFKFGFIPTTEPNTSDILKYTVVFRARPCFQVRFSTHMVLSCLRLCASDYLYRNNHMDDFRFYFGKG